MTKTWMTALFLLALVFTTLSAGSAEASIAPPPPAYRVYAEAEVVFVGVVTHIEGGTMHVRREAVLKGTPGETVIVTPIFSPGCRPGTPQSPVVAIGDRVLVAAKKEAKFYRLVNHMVRDAKLNDAATEKAKVAFAKRMVQITALPSFDERARTFVGLLTSKSPLLADAAADFVLLELNTPAKAARHGKGLLAGLHTKGKYTRLWSLHALRGVAPEGGFQRIAALASGDDRSEVLAACAAVTAFDRAEAIPLVRAAAKRWKNPYLLANLGASPLPEAFEHLRKMLKSDTEAANDKDLRASALRGYTLRQRTYGSTSQDVDDLLDFLRNRMRQGLGNDVRHAFGATASIVAVDGLIALVRDTGSEFTQRDASYSALHELATSNDDPKLVRDSLARLRKAEKVFIERIDGGEEDMFLCWLLGLIHTDAARAALVRREKRDPPDRHTDAWRALHYWDK